jgi:sarcosine oxidase subunit delta
VTQLICPFCGPRELNEFEFRKTLPTLQSTPFEREYLRVDRQDLSIEHWQHVFGCRAWLLIHRNPTTDAILFVRLLDGDAE